MIDFTTKQLSWLIVSSVTVGGGGYITMNHKVDEIDKKLAVAINSYDNSKEMMNKIEQQLVRIEEKLDRVKRDK